MGFFQYSNKIAQNYFKFRFEFNNLSPTPEIWRIQYNRKNTVNFAVSFDKIGKRWTELFFNTQIVKKSKKIIHIGLNLWNIDMKQKKLLIEEIPTVVYFLWEWG